MRCRFSRTATKRKREIQVTTMVSKHRRARLEQLKDGSVAEGCNVCNAICAVSSVCRAICPGASLARASARIRRDPRYQKSGVSAPALITARRRSYFTPRSSIIHAVNNAPLFRVTLYQVSFLPSFLHSSPPISFLLSFSVSSCEGARISQGSHPTRRGRGARCWDTLISRFIHRNEDTLRSARSRRA